MFAAQTAQTAAKAHRREHTGCTGVAMSCLFGDGANSADVACVCVHSFKQLASNQSGDLDEGQGREYRSGYELCFTLAAQATKSQFKSQKVHHQMRTHRVTPQTRHIPARAVATIAGHSIKRHRHLCAPSNHSFAFRMRRRAQTMC